MDILWLSYIVYNMDDISWGNYSISYKDIYHGEILAYHIRIYIMVNL